MREPLPRYRLVRFVVLIVYAEALGVAAIGLGGWLAAVGLLVPVTDALSLEVSLGLWASGGVGGALWLVVWWCAAALLAGVGQAIEMVRQMTINSDKQLWALKDIARRTGTTQQSQIPIPGRRKTG